MLLRRAPVPALVHPYCRSLRLHLLGLDAAAPRQPPSHCASPTTVRIESPSSFPNWIRIAMAGVLGRLRGAWGWYQVKLAQQPVRTQMLSSGILWATGDYAAQSISRRIERSKVADSPSSKTMERDSDRTEWKRVALASSFGVGFVGPLGHFWYEGLERFVLHGLKLRANSVRFIATKVACDCLLFGPIHLLAFFTYIGVMSGRPWETVKRDLERDFIPTYMTEGVGWGVVQVVNFRLVPVRHQLLFVNVFCLIDSAFLSWVKHQDDAPWKKYLTSLVSRKPSESAT